MRLHKSTVLALVAIAGLSASSTAQTIKLGLLPGLGESASNWSDAISTINGSLSLAAIFAPSPTTTAALPSQLSAVQSGYSSYLGSNTILIGHSNGGIVARLAAQSQSLYGTATIGTPNQGLPLRTNAGDVVEYGSDMAWDLTVTVNDFLTGDYYWAWDNVVGDYLGGYDYIADLLEQASIDAGVGTAPANEVDVAEHFLDDTLNLTGNVTTELSNASISVGVAVTADGYYYGGPYRLVAVDAADAEGESIFVNTLAADMLLIEGTIYDDSDPMTDQDYREVDDLDLLSTLLFDVETVWCTAVSTPQSHDPWVFLCDDNDGLIGIEHQARPGSVTGVNWSGSGAPAHLTETEEGARIVSLLSSQFGVP